MTIVQAKSFLQGLRTIEQQIAEKDHVLQMMRTQWVLPSVKTTGTKPKTSTLDSGFEQIRCIAMKLENEKNALEETFDRNRAFTLQCLSYIQKEQYCTILFFRYLCGDSWDTICQKMNYSTRRIFQLHTEAIAEFAAQAKDDSMIT